MPVLDQAAVGVSEDRRPARVAERSDVRLDRAGQPRTFPPGAYIRRTAPRRRGSLRRRVLPPAALNILALIWRELGELSRERPRGGSAGDVEHFRWRCRRRACRERAPRSGRVRSSGRRPCHRYRSPGRHPTAALRSGRFRVAHQVAQPGDLRGTEPAKRRRAPGFVPHLRLSQVRGARAVLPRPDRGGRHGRPQLTGSGWFVARVAPEPIARQHADSLPPICPPDLRTGFVDRGLLIRRFQCP